MTDEMIRNKIKSIRTALADVDKKLEQTDDCFRRGQHITGITHAQQAEDMLRQIKNRILYLFGLEEGK